MSFFNKFLVFPVSIVIVYFSNYFSDNTFQTIDFENVNLQQNLEIENTDKNYTYDVAIKGFENERNVAITSTEKFEGQNSISYYFTETSGLGPQKNSLMDIKGNGTDKVHHNIIPTELKRKKLIEFGKPYFFGFAFKIDRNSEIPEKDKGIIIFQLWQGSPFSPPLKIDLINKNSEFALQVFAKNDATGSNPSSPLIHIGNAVQVNKDIWYRVVIGMTINHINMNKRGKVNFWLAREKEPLRKVASWIGYAGYDPKKKGNYAGKQDVPNPNLFLQPTYGIYRERQERVITVYFDNIKVTESLSSADPNFITKRK